MFLKNCNFAHFVMPQKQMAFFFVCNKFKYENWYVKKLVLQNKEKLKYNHVWYLRG